MEKRLTDKIKEFIELVKSRGDDVAARVLRFLVAAIGPVEGTRALSDGATAERRKVSLGGLPGLFDGGLLHTKAEALAEAFADERGKRGHVWADEALHRVVSDLMIAPLTPPSPTAAPDAGLAARVAAVEAELARRPAPATPAAPEQA